MTEDQMAAWPTATLDRVARLRVLADALPGVHVEERTIPVPFERLWPFVSDLEHNVARFDRDVWAVRILRRSDDGTPRRLRAWPSPAPFDVELREGWCWMHSALYVVGMAAEPTRDGTATRFAHVEGLPPMLPRRLRWLQRPVDALSRWRHVRHLRRDVDGIERCLGVRP